MAGQPGSVRASSARERLSESIATPSGEELGAGDRHHERHDRGQHVDRGE